MFLRVLSVFLFFWIATIASAQDDVTRWLQRMGCDELLASYLEEQLEEGNRNAKVRAAKQLADVYAIMLARADQGDDHAVLERALALFDRIPEAGTTELRLQLYRATYIAAEQILERYRLRISDREEANIAITQLREVAEDLDSLHTSLQRSFRSSRSLTERKKHQLGLVTSYLAWARYYIAWHEGDQAQASLAADLFAEILLGDRPNLSEVSLDLKSHETGARAILGIALCKAIEQDPAGPDPWFDELEDYSTWSSVRQAVPLWKFFLHVDQKHWQDVLTDLNTQSLIDKGLMYRVAATHSLENYSNSIAKEVAKQSLTGLVELGQLGIVSDIVKKFGSDALPKNGFISNYIEGDIQFRKTKEIHESDEPSQEETIIQEFSSVATLFKNAIRSQDVNEYTSLVDDCQFMLGLAYYYSGQFGNAADAFQKSAEGDNKEQSIWMAIVSLDYIVELNLELQVLKEELSKLYVQNWPDTQHATQLTIHRSETENPNPQNIEDLLSISHSDPKYEEAQRQAARSLYNMWGQASSLQRSEVGNKYVGVAMPLLITDLNKEDDVHATEVSAVRALRLLEISLHPEVMRMAAAARAIEALDAIEKQQTYSIDEFLNEINFRKIQLQLVNGDTERAATKLLHMIDTFPLDRWTTLSATALWNEVSSDDSITSELQFAIGNQILNQLQEHQYSSKEYIAIATATAHAAFTMFMNDDDVLLGEEALRISRLLVSQKPRIVQILILNAQIEMELGDSQIALKRWKTIKSGSKRGSLQWLQARFNSILMLSVESPVEALAVLDQHVILYPNYGVEPYGSKLKNLHLQLRNGQNGT